MAPAVVLAMLLMNDITTRRAFALLTISPPPRCKVFLVLENVELQVQDAWSARFALLTEKSPSRMIMWPRMVVPPFK